MISNLLLDIQDVFTMLRSTVKGLIIFFPFFSAWRKPAEKRNDLESRSNKLDGCLWSRIEKPDQWHRLFTIYSPESPRVVTFLSLHIFFCFKPLKAWVLAPACIIRPSINYRRVNLEIRLVSDTSIRPLPKLFLIVGFLYLHNEWSTDSHS